MLYYTGVGSRRTPDAILEIIHSVARKLDTLGWWLRTGNAYGADEAFRDHATHRTVYTHGMCTPEAMEIARRFHPAWDRCSDIARKLHGRNAFQVLGDDLETPSKFVVCWTPDGAVSHVGRSIRTGGTGTAISIADHYGIPVFNLQRPDHLNRLMNFIKS